MKQISRSGLPFDRNTRYRGRALGLVRIILALAVLLGHAADQSIFGFRLPNPAFAVEAFFIS